MSKRGKTVCVSLATVAALAFSVYGWPGLWVYGTTSTEMYRVNRFTGTKEWASDPGWMTIEQQSAMSRERRQKEVAQFAREIEVKSKTVAFATKDSERLRVDVEGGGTELFYADAEIARIESALHAAGVQVGNSR